MNEVFANRYSAGIAAVVFAGFWLALSACMPDAHRAPQAWKPVSIAKASSPAIRSAQFTKLAATAKSDAKIALAKASVSADSAPPTP